MKWYEALKQNEDFYNEIVNLAYKAIKELKSRQFIKKGQPVVAFLNLVN